MRTQWIALAAGLSAAVGIAPPVDAAPIERVGHTDMAWTVTTADGGHPPDAFGGSSGGPWAGADRIWSQPGFTGSYTLRVDGDDVAAYCADFHNARSPDHAGEWSDDRSVFEGSAKALAKLSFVQWKWGGTTDPDVAAAVNLYSHFLGSPEDRSNNSGVPVPDINDNDVLDELVTVAPPHEAVGPIMDQIDRAAEAWSAAFEHDPANIALGIEVIRTDDDLQVRATSTGQVLPSGSYVATDTAEGPAMVTAGVARALRDITNGSQHSLTAGPPNSAGVPAVEPSDVTLRSQISDDRPTVGTELSDAIEISGLVGTATATVEVQLVDLTVDPDGVATPLAAETRSGLVEGVTTGFAAYEIGGDVAGHLLGYRHRLVSTTDGAPAQSWSELGIASETGRVAPLRAAVHLRKTVSSAAQERWVDAQRGAPWSHDPAAASSDPRTGAFDDASAHPGDAVPVYRAGTEIMFRYEIWLDDDSDGAVRWNGDDIVLDDAGTVDDTDDFVPVLTGGDDGDGLLEAGEVWVFGAPGTRTAVAGEEYLNTATLRPGDVADPANGRPTGEQTARRRDPAGYVVPAVSTSAADRADGDRVLDHDGGVVVDTVAYRNLVPGVEYEAVATVVDAETGEATGSGGTTTFTPSSSEGTVEVVIEVAPDPSTGVAPSGAAVVFETVSVVATGAVVATHADLADAAQTFEILPAPIPTTTTGPSPTTTEPTAPTAPTVPVTVPPREIPRTGDEGGHLVADLAAACFGAGSLLLGLAWWRRPDDAISNSLVP